MERTITNNGGQDNTFGNHNGIPTVTNIVAERDIQNIASDFDIFANTDNRFHAAMIKWISNGYEFIIKDTIPSGQVLQYSHDKSIFPNDFVTAQEIIDTYNVTNPMFIAIIATLNDDPLLESNLTLVNNVIASGGGSSNYFTYIG